MLDVDFMMSFDECVNFLEWYHGCGWDHRMERPNEPACPTSWDEYRFEWCKNKVGQYIVRTDSDAIRSLDIAADMSLSDEEENDKKYYEDIAELIALGIIPPPQE